MSAGIDPADEPSNFQSAADAHSDLGDGSSSLSDIEDKDTAQDELDESESEQLDHEEDPEEDDDVDMESDANDSEAETERLENTPQKLRKHTDVVISSQAEDQIYERSPSKLHLQFTVTGEEDDEDEDELSDDDISINESVVTSTRENDENDENDEGTTAIADIPLEDTPDRANELLKVVDNASRKRKRSLLPERRSIEPDELDEPARKRTGSINALGDDYNVDDAASGSGDIDTSNPISGNISDADSPDAENDHDDEDIAETERLKAVDARNEDLESSVDISRSNDEKLKLVKGRRSAGPDQTDPLLHQDDEEMAPAEGTIPGIEIDDGDEHDDVAENEVDEAEAALRSEEEQERKKVAIDFLNNIERHFSAFRDRLHEDRLAQLDQEEAMLKADVPTHPQYLEMMRCVDKRRDDRLRIGARLTEYKIESLTRTAVARRSQVLAQYHQDVRDYREKKLEMLGKQWYEVQHDRRGYGSNGEDYSIRFPTKRTQQVMHHNSYTKEVSLLSGIAKYVGFPAAPNMNVATQAEVDQDLEKIERARIRTHVLRPSLGLPLQEFAAIRKVASTSSFKPAEEQFIEQTPWANPQHPSNAHLMPRQASGHQIPRNASPFSAPGIRRHSSQVNGAPVAGTFSSTIPTGATHTAAYMSGGRVSPINPFASNSSSQKTVPLPIGSRQTSLSPQQEKTPSQLLQPKQDHKEIVGQPLEAERKYVSDMEASRPSDMGSHFAYPASVPAK